MTTSLVYLGTWESPVTTGTPPPPCQGFTFTQVDSGRVVLFGGFEPTTRRRVNDVYILNLHTKVGLNVLFRRPINTCCCCFNTCIIYYCV